MKRTHDHSFLLPHKKRKLNLIVPNIDTIPLELIFNIVRYLDTSTDINIFIYSINNLRSKFENDRIWKLMLYQNLENPIINNQILWRDNYYNNMNISNKYNLKIVPVCDDKTDYHIISVSDITMRRICNNVNVLNTNLEIYRDSVYQQKKDSEYVKSFVGSHPITKVIFLDIFTYNIERVNRIIISNTPEDLEFIKIFDQIDEIVTYTNYDSTNYNNRICIQSNILTADDIIFFIMFNYQLLLFKDSLSPLFTYKYKNSNVLGYQLEVLNY